MSMKVSCACGAEFNAKPELAGKTVKCPTCGGSFNVPKAHAPSPSIRVKCRCGSTFNAKSALAGKRVKCPSCGDAIAVPNPYSTAATIRIACNCGNAFKAKSQLAGKRVKCPSCGHTIQIPAKEVVEKRPVDLEDPIGLATSPENPLSADFGVATAVAGFDTLRAPPLGPVLRKSEPAGRTGRGSHGGESATLIIVAGVIAVGYGGLLTLLNGFSLIMAVAGTVGSAWGGRSISATSTLDIAYIALSFWLAKSGIDIVRNESREESLHEAAKASAIYLAFGFLGLLLMGLLLALTSVAAAVLKKQIGSIPLWWVLIVLVYMVPPAFILYVHRYVSTGAAGLRNPVVVSGAATLSLVVLVFGSLRTWPYHIDTRTREQTKGCRTPAGEVAQTQISTDTRHSTGCV